MPKTEVGKVTHFFDHIGVGVLELSGGLKVGDKIAVETHEGEFEQVVDSMQIDKQPVKSAKKGQAIGIKLAQPVKGKAIVYKVTE
ncbi:MAG: hypothetical protein JW772_02700 [Candidatus Diapherotrites archaeon]|nr:hypothetical protein [Candidatus Diapherotrites archaeon]